jgi:hypothetical protein
MQLFATAGARIKTTPDLLFVACVQELRQLLHQQSSASSAALDAERTAAAQQADECAVVAAASAQAASAAALHAAEVRGALLEGQLDSVERERDVLARQVGVLTWIHAPHMHVVLALLQQLCVCVGGGG